MKEWIKSLFSESNLASMARVISFWIMVGWSAIVLTEVILFFKYKTWGLDANIFSYLNIPVLGLPPIAGAVKVGSKMLEIKDEKEQK